MCRNRSTAGSVGQAALPIVAVDIGNARIKFGRFDAFGCEHDHRSRTGPAMALPSPAGTLSLDTLPLEFEHLTVWLRQMDRPVVSWWIGSVNRPAATRLLDWLRTHRPYDSVTLLSAADLSLTVRLAEPDRVGVDRLLDAVAANVLRGPGRAAVVVDVGTAITVDLVASDGAFCGGAIVPGIAMSARALHEFTDLLPRVDTAELRDPPPPVGASTIEAMRSGLFWFAVGAIRELTARMAQDRGPAEPRRNSDGPHIFLTGGASSAVAGLLGPEACCVPHLTLAGIALTARVHTATESRGSGPDRSASQ